MGKIVIPLRGINGNKIEVIDDVVETLAACNIGDSVEVEIVKVVDGQIHCVTINTTLANRGNFDID